METAFCSPVSTSFQRPAVANYEIAGRTISFDYKDVQLPQLAELLASYYCSVVSAKSITHPDATIRLQVEGVPFDIADTFDRFEISNGGVGYTDGSTCVFDFEKGRVIVHRELNQIDLLMRTKLDLERFDDLQIVNYAISTALRRCDVYELHSGAVVDPQTERGVLFAGASGSGKSTLTLQLVGKGWRYLTDDVLLLKNVRGVMKAYPLRRAFAVTQSTVEASGNRVREALANVDWLNGSKKPFMPNEVFPETFLPDCKPQAIFFPTITDEDQSVVRPLTRSETMIHLIKLCPWSCYDPVTSAGHLHALSSLARQCEGFVLLAGRDLLRDPVRASDLVREHTSSGWQ